MGREHATVIIKPPFLSHCFKIAHLQATYDKSDCIWACAGSGSQGERPFWEGVLPAAVAGCMEFLYAFIFNVFSRRLATDFPLPN